MDKEQFKKELLKKLKSVNSKKEHTERIEYLKVSNDKEYKDLKKEIKEQILLDEVIEEDLKYL